MTREAMVAVIMAYDLNAVAQDIQDGDLTYLVSILSGGVGWTQYADMTDDDVAKELEEGEYGSQAKQDIIRTGPLADHPYVVQLLAKYDAEADGTLPAGED